MRRLAILFLAVTAAAAQPIPSILWGKWTIKRSLPTQSISCWDDKQAKALIGTELEYASNLFRWNTTITKNPVAQSATITAQQFHDENSGRGKDGSQVSFQQLGIKEPQVIQIEIMHKPAEITGGTVEIPGDRVLMKSPNTMILTACNIYFEATRLTPKRK